MREVSRIALASAAMSGMALAALGGVRAAWPELMPEPARLIMDGSTYVAEEYRLVGRAFVIGVAVSCGLAWLAYRVGPARSKSASRPNDTVWTVLHESAARPGARGAADVVPVVELRTRDQTLYRGQVAAYDPVGSRSDRMIALAAPVHVSRGSCEFVTIDKPWERLAIPMEDILEMYVAFTAAATAQS